MGETARGFGVFAGIAHDLIRSVAANTETLRYDSFWVNHPGTVDGLASLAAAATATRQIKVGIGVIPLTTRNVTSIVAGVHDQSLPLDRLLLGIGSPNPGALNRVREGVRDLKAQLSTTIVVAALGPNMCRLAGEVADGVLLNWLTPEFAKVAADWVFEGASAAGREPPTIYAYQRVALGPDARMRLTAEAGNYARIPQYAQHFDRMGKTPVEASVAGDTPAEIQSGLSAWDGIVDEVIVRAIASSESLDAYLDLLRAAAPG